MTTAAIKQTHQVSLTSIGLALGGVVLAVGAGFGAAAVMLDDDPPATVPEQTYFPVPTSAPAPTGRTAS
jgi:hypothetical protein